jgi:DNA-binding NarL/FixJ family response regulator
MNQKYLKEKEYLSSIPAKNLYGNPGRVWSINEMSYFTQGLSNKEIAKKIGRTIRAVKKQKTKFNKREYKIVGGTNV